MQLESAEQLTIDGAGEGTRKSKQMNTPGAFNRGCWLALCREKRGDH